MANKKVVNKNIKLKVFVSHKHKDEEAARKIIKKLEVYAAEKIEFYLSEDNPFGVNWQNVVHAKLKEADLLLLLYTDPSAEWDWCMYETGFFSRGMHDKKEDGHYRLICLHRPEDNTPNNLQHWHSLATTKKDLGKLLKELYTGINEHFLDNKESKDDVIESIIEAFSPELKRRHYTKYMHICIDKEAIQQLTEKSIISNKAIIRSDEKSLKLFNLLPISENDVEWCWKDIQGALTQSDQKNWAILLTENMTNAYKHKEFSRGLPLFQSLDDKKFYRPMLHRLDRMPNGISKFTVLFIPTEVAESHGMIGDFNMVFTLLKLGHRFRWNVIEKYLLETRSIRSKISINLSLTNLDLALIKSESEAAAVGVFTEENISSVFDEEGKQEFYKFIKVWGNIKKTIGNNIRDRDLKGVKDRLIKLRETNNDFMVFISGKYHELFQNIEEYKEKAKRNNPKKN